MVSFLLFKNPLNELRQLIFLRTIFVFSRDKEVKTFQQQGENSGRALSASLCQGIFKAESIFRMKEKCKLNSAEKRGIEYNTCIKVNNLKALRV
jgi:hypothetical protein